MKTLFSGVGNRKFLLIGVAVASLTTLSYFHTRTSSQVQNLSVLTDGAHTCFTRVQQSFMARMLGDTKSQYLTSEFMGSTEKCLGEVGSLAETHFIGEMAEAQKKINTLATDVHWFHDRISPSSDTFTKSAAGVLISNIGGRFAKLEMAHNFVLDELQSMHKSLGATLSTLTWALQLCGGFALILIGLEVFQRRSQSKEFDRLESEAKRLSGEQDMAALRVQEVLKQALKLKGMENCHKLFSQFHLYKTKIRSEAVYAPYGQIQTAQARPGENNEEVIDEIWERSEHDDSHLVVYDEMFQREKNEILTRHVVQPEGLDALSIDEVTSKMIDHLSSQIFTKGVQIEMNLSEDHGVYAQNEELEQIICQGIALMLKDNARSLKVTSKQLGNVVVVDLEAIGTGFSDDLIKAQLTSSQQSSVEAPMELMICRELCSDISAKVSYDNIYADNGTIEGRSLRLTFKSAPLEKKSSKKLVSLEKGTKTEVLKRIQEGA